MHQFPERPQSREQRSVQKNSSQRDFSDKYEDAVEMVEHQSETKLPADHLFNLEALATDGKIQVSTWSKYSLESGAQKYDLWMTIPDEFTSNMIAAINEMQFNGDVHQELADRINQHLGMDLDSADDRNARKVWRGTMNLKQARPGTDPVGIFRPCLQSYDFTTSSCEYVDLSESYDWARNWAHSAWTTGSDAYPWTGEGYTFDWGKNFEPQQGKAEKPIGSQEFVVLGSNDDGEGTDIEFRDGVDPVTYFCEACVDAGECTNFLNALKVASKDQCKKNSSQRDFSDKYEDAVEMVEHQSETKLPADHLFNLEALATDGKIQVSTWSKYSLESGPQKYDLWMTIPDEFTSNMIAAINEMQFNGDVHQELADRINQHLG